jgi:tRNA threonylcarbamoyladenosine biosynthesis protein TsaB
MIVLGLDTSTAATAVALRLADGSSTQARDDPPAGAHPGHATRLLGMADALLERAGIGWSEIERIAVGVGPGTFTGLRVGVASARGLAQSLSIELVGVSSTAALALGALRAEPRGAAGESAVLAVIDARRGEVFAAAYELGEAALPRELAAPRALAPQALEGVLGEARDAGGARAPGWLAVGDGAVRYRAQLQAIGVPSPPDSSPLQLVSAAAVCELGVRMPATARERILPDYRRRPDAELALDGAGIGKGL